MRLDQYLEPCFENLALLRARETQKHKVGEALTTKNNGRRVVADNASYENSVLCYNSRFKIGILYLLWVNCAFVYLPCQKGTHSTLSWIAWLRFRAIFKFFYLIFMIITCIFVNPPP